MTFAGYNPEDKGVFLPVLKCSKSNLSHIRVPLDTINRLRSRGWLSTENWRQIRRLWIATGIGSVAFVLLLLAIADAHASDCNWKPGDKRSAVRSILAKPGMLSIDDAPIAAVDRAAIMAGDRSQTNRITRSPDDVRLQGVRKIRDRLVHAADLDDEAWSIQLFEREDIFEAEIPGRTVTVTVGLLEAAKSDTALAFAISHCLGHLLMDHRRSALHR